MANNNDIESKVKNIFDKDSPKSNKKNIQFLECIANEQGEISVNFTKGKKKFNLNSRKISYLLKAVKEISNFYKTNDFNLKEKTILFKEFKNFYDITSAKKRSTSEIYEQINTIKGCIYSFEGHKFIY